MDFTFRFLLWISGLLILGLAVALLTPENTNPIERSSVSSHATVPPSADPRSARPDTGQIQATKTPEQPIAQEQPSSASLLEVVDESIPGENIVVYQKKSRAFRRWRSAFENDKEVVIDQELARRFKREEIDFNWALEHEKKLLNLFFQNPNLNGLALKDVQCRTTQCRIMISISNIEQANASVNRLSEALKQNDEGLSPAMIITALDQKEGLTTLYISRNKNSFNFN